MHQKILVPLDGSPLSEAALEHLRHVVGAETEVVLLRVLDMADEPSPVATGAETTPVPPIAPAPRVREATRAATAKAFLDAEGYLQARAATLGGRVRATRTLVLRDGAPATTIASVAADEQADLIVMATHGRSGVVRWVLGSVAERVLHASDRPLLLVRPGRPVA